MADFQKGEIYRFLKVYTYKNIVFLEGDLLEVVGLLDKQNLAITKTVRSQYNLNWSFDSLHHLISIGVLDLFELSTVNYHNPKFKEPKDNNGREICFWCEGTTIKMPCWNSWFDFCTKCKK